MLVAPLLTPLYVKVLREVEKLLAACDFGLCPFHNSSLVISATRRKALVQFRKKNIVQPQLAVSDQPGAQ